MASSDGLNGASVPKSFMSAKQDEDDLMPTRWSLIARLKNWQDEVTWRDFFDIYWRLIYHSAKHAGCTPSEAEDVVQETLISVAKQINGFRSSPEHGSFKAWLMRLARCRIADQFRRRARRAEVAAGPSPSNEGGTTPLHPADLAVENLPEIWDREWEQQLMRAALEVVRRKVDSKHFQIFHLLVIEDQPIKEVARTLGWSVPRLYLIKHRLSVLVRKEVRKLERGLAASRLTQA